MILQTDAHLSKNSLNRRTVTEIVLYNYNTQSQQRSTYIALWKGLLYCISWTNPIPNYRQHIIDWQHSTTTHPHIQHSPTPHCLIQCNRCSKIHDRWSSDCIFFSHASSVPTPSPRREHRSHITTSNGERPHGTQDHSTVVGCQARKSCLFSKLSLLGRAGFRCSILG